MIMKARHIAVLGATGYIGRSMAVELSLDQTITLTLFSRDIGKVRDFVDKHIVAKERIHIASYEDFASLQYDVIFNCAGIGSPREYKKNPAAIFEVTEKMDNMVIPYLVMNPRSMYINLSTGSVYGLAAQGIVHESTRAVLEVNNIAPAAYYSIAKINSEAKHRAYAHLNIVDLRVFSFFSRFADPEDKFLLSDIVKSMNSGVPMKTGASSVIRDYVCPSELSRIIGWLLEGNSKNDVYDVVSLAPVAKFELLDYLKKHFTFNYVVEDGGSNISPTGDKNEYYSQSKKLELIGYTPKLTSLEGINEELMRMLGAKTKNRIA